MPINTVVVFLRNPRGESLPWPMSFLLEYKNHGSVLPLLPEDFNMVKLSTGCGESIYTHLIALAASSAQGIIIDPLYSSFLNYVISRGSNGVIP